MPKFNPYRPGKIVAPGMFAGRTDELDKLERILFQVKSGSAHHFLLQGERGIGKSSLLFYVQKLARREITLPSGGGFSFLAVSLELEPSFTYEDILFRVGGELRRELAGHRKARHFATTIWEFVKKWEVMGVKYNSDLAPAERSQQLEDLVAAFIATVEAIRPELDGVLLLIDEADKAPVSANLGEFCKLFTERLTKRGCEHVALGLSGLPRLVENLRESHESSPRIFEIFTLAPLLPKERRWVVQQGLREARSKNAEDISATETALEFISNLSEGYPHFVQEFAYWAFEANTDDIIDVDDVAIGALQENGALQQLGVKYFHELYFNQIASDSYRAVLHEMAKNSDGWTTRQHLLKACGLPESTLKNAIHTLAKRTIILPKEGKPGIYRLPSKAFAAWLNSREKLREATS